MCSDRIPGNSGQSGDETRRKAEQAEQLKLAGAESVQAGQLAEAIKSLLQASQLAPDSASIFVNLSAAYGADQQFDQALEAAEKAIQLNPKSAVAHLNRSFALQSVGRHEDAATAQSRAIQLGSPEFLTDLARNLRARGDWKTSMECLYRALSISPREIRATLDLAAICVYQRKTAEGRQLFQHVRDAADADPKLRRFAQVTCTILDDHTRLEPAIDRAVRDATPDPILQALRERSSSESPVDGAILERLTTIANRLQSEPSRMAELIQQPDIPQPSPAVEACFTQRASNDMESVAKTLQLMQQTERGESDRRDDEIESLLRTRRLILDRRTQDVNSRSPLDWEVWLRYCHAQQMWHHKHAFPGQFKPLPDQINQHRPTAKPEEVVGTLARFFEDIWPTVAPGAIRAVFVYLALLEMRAFFDGNGRVARFVMNEELAAAGLPPLVIPDAVRDELFQAGQELKMEPMFRALEQAVDVTRELVQQLPSLGNDF